VVQGSLPQLLIQNRAKTKGYRGKKKFTAIVHSKRAKTMGYRGIKHFTEINHSKKPQNAGLSG
jgi:hypothetical protein